MSGLTVFGHLPPRYLLGVGMLAYQGVVESGPGHTVTEGWYRLGFLAADWAPRPSQCVLHSGFPSRARHRDSLRGAFE